MSCSILTSANVADYEEPPPAPADVDLGSLRESAERVAGAPFKDEKVADYVSRINDKDSEIRALEKEVKALEKEIESIDISDDDSLVASEEIVRGEISEAEEEEIEAAGNFEATAYTAYCDTGCTGVTATGIDVSNTIYKDGKRIIAADPSVMPLGTNVIVTTADGNSFEAVAADTGGDIVGNRIDILVNSVDEALEFGRRSVNIEIINEGER